MTQVMHKSRRNLMIAIVRRVSGVIVLVLISYLFISGRIAVGDSPRGPGISSEEVTAFLFLALLFFSSGGALSQIGMGQQQRFASTWTLATFAMYVIVELYIGDIRLSGLDQEQVSVLAWKYLPLIGILALQLLDLILPPGPQKEEADEEVLA